MDFERWFDAQGQPTKEDLEEKLFNDLEKAGFEVNWKGQVECACCVCGGVIYLSDYLTREECLEADPKDQYCGGSPRCCP